MNEKDMLIALMQEEGVTEIMVDAPDSVYVERRGKPVFLSPHMQRPSATRYLPSAASGV